MPKKVKNPIARKCGICRGNQYLTFEHISSHIHRAAVNKLPMHPRWWLLDDKELKKILNESD